MNHNSFPTGEQAPDQQDSGDAVEFPSFEEHMQQMEQQKGGEKEKGSLIERAKKAIDNILHRRERIEHNMQELNRPTLKNTELKGDAVFRDKGVEIVHNKLKNGEPLSGEDITGMVFPEYVIEDSEKIFGGIGIENGSDFDVDLPKTMFNDDGSTYETPLSVSFKNPDGEFTRINIEKGDGEVVLTSYRGKRENGADVSYRGPISREGPKLTTYVKFDYVGKTTDKIVTPSDE